jgi:hypothetical protein
MTVTISRFLETRRRVGAAAKSKQSIGAAASIPTIEEARARLKAARGRPQPWLTPEAFGAAKDVPEVIGPEKYRKP